MRKSYEAINICLRLRYGVMKTYNQTKIGVVYFYPKRIVLDDGVSTVSPNIQKVGLYETADPSSGYFI